MLTGEHGGERARHAKREDFVAFLNGSPGIRSMPGDETGLRLNPWERIRPSKLNRK